MNGLPIFLCSYYKSYGFGAFDEIYAMCFANTEQEALGLILTEYPKTDVKNWSIVEQFSDTLSVIEISSRSD